MLSLASLLCISSLAYGCTEPNEPHVEPTPETPAAGRFEVFQMPTPTEGDIPYRIPALAATQDGTLVAVSDYRHS